MADIKPVFFNAGQVRRLVQATQAVERAYRLPPAPGEQFSRGGPGGVIPAKTTSAISAKSGSTAGSGSIELYEMAETGVLTATGITLTVWNMGGSVASGKDVLVAFGTRGPWIVVEPC